MSKTVTLRLDEKTYKIFRRRAEVDNRPISNLVETAALRHLQEVAYVEPEEMDEILEDKELIKALQVGSRQVRQGKTKKLR